MKASSGRLDVPGFSHGQKTGEYIDVPRIYGGKGAKRKSKKPHSFTELVSRTALKSAERAASKAREEYYKAKRLRFKKAKKPITHISSHYCTRRYLEFQGLKIFSFKYSEPPELITPNPKTVYEVTDGLLSYVSFTSAMEAQLM